MSMPFGTGAQTPERAGEPGGHFQRLQSPEDALKYRRARVSEPCAVCLAAPDGRCDDHGRDLDLISEYEHTARQLLQAAP